MRNLKFGVFCLGLILMVGALVTSVSAQGPGPSMRERRPMVDVFSFNSGSQLGVMVSDLDAKAASGGVKIDEVNPDSPAEKAGIKAGDVVVEYDGEKVRSARQFTRLVQETVDGRTVSIALMRDGKKQTLSATPESGRMTWNSGKPELHGFAVPDMRDFNFQYDDQMPRRFEYRAPERFFRLPAPGAPFVESRPRLGVQVQPMTRDLEEYFGVTNGGALVSSVTPDSAASKAGIKAGDVIVSINGHSVRDADDLLRELDDVTGDATIVVMRDKKELTLKATIERREEPRARIRPRASR
jgi:serine protease Do